MIADRILQDALEQQRQLCCRLIGIAFREPEHRILYQVQRELLFSNRENGLFECPALHFGEEVGELLFGSQSGPLIGLWETTQRKY